MQPSTRRLTRERRIFTRKTEGSKSLSRGLVLLRAFLEGAPVLTNQQLAERTGTPKPTVSRLTRSLVEAGFLEYDFVSEGYRLASVCLSLGRAFRFAHSEFNPVRALLQEVARREKVNVGLSVPDGCSMVYLETVREAPGSHLRLIAPGWRLDMASTSAGHAYIAALPAGRRREVLERLRIRRQSNWLPLKKGITTSIKSVSTLGYCWWKPISEIEAIACPMQGPDGSILCLNFSYPARTDSEHYREKLSSVLISLALEIRREFEQLEPLRE